MSEHNAEQVHHQIKIYIRVFATLAVLTAATVLASRAQFAPALAIFIGLAIAAVKGGLVASFFMHLKTETRWIYGVLLLTAFFFVALFGLMFMTTNDTFGEVVHPDLGTQAADQHETGHDGGH